MRRTETATDTSTSQTSVEDWLVAFQSALQQSDGPAIEQLFATDGSWRDALAFTWSLRTFVGLPEITAALTRASDAIAPVRISLKDEPAPRVVRRAGQECIEAFFELETAVGAGAGVVRLVPDDGGTGARAWTLFTAL